MSTVDPSSIGISADRMERAYSLLEDAVRADAIPGAALLVARHGTALPVKTFGTVRPDPDAAAIDERTIFLVASVTKPVTVAAVMLLVERGHVLLDDPVCSIIPEFANHRKEDVTIRHLMTHTSGLPDMIQENERLRNQRAPVSEFVRRIHDLSLDYPPGTNIRYQSSGIAILGEIVERVSGVPLDAFMRREIFEPLGMADTSLGADESRFDRIAHVRSGGNPPVGDARWNTPYWWGFKSPWGGILSTVADTFRFAQAFLDRGAFRGTQVFSPATVDAMVANQTAGFRSVPEEKREAQQWGLGWRLHPTGDWTYYGDLLTRGSFGHGGATGTVVWADPGRDMVCVVFTTQPVPVGHRLIGRVSNLVAASAL